MTTQNAKVTVKYTDGTEESYGSIKEAEKGILETITGCDFAVNVQDIEYQNGKNKSDLYCKWHIELIERKRD